MTFRIPGFAGRIGRAAAIGALALLATPPALAGEAADVKGEQVAQADSNSATSSTSAVNQPGAIPVAAPSALRAMLRVDASVGAGSFVSGVQNNTALSTAWTPTLSYGLTERVTLSGTIAAAMYHINDTTVPFENGRVLLSDASLGVAHSKIWGWSPETEAGAPASGVNLNLSGAFRLYLPTSEASLMQDRLFSMRPTLTFGASWGPLSAGWTAGFMKYFMTSSNPSIDCEEWAASGECLSGRGTAPGGRFESERRGGEVYLPSAGVNSFYVMNSFSLGWQIVDGLSLGASATVFNIFGVRAFEVDDMSSPNARSGRAQTDRLVTDLGITYRIVRQLSVGASLSTDTVQPFGANGEDFVWQGFFGRASDNISSVNFSIIGSL